MLLVEQYTLRGNHIKSVDDHCKPEPLSRALTQKLSMLHGEKLGNGPNGPGNEATGSRVIVSTNSMHSHLL